jgi:hypothetical protein
LDISKFRLADVAVGCLQQSIAKITAGEIMLYYQSVNCVNELASNGEIRDLGHHEFGRIYQRFWLACCCGSPRLQSE